MPSEQEADAEHVDQHAVERASRGASRSSSSAWMRVDGAARSLVRHEERRPGRLGGGCTSSRGGVERAAGDDDAREPEREEARARACLRARRERVEVRELGLAEDLHARRDDAVEVAGEREARLLDARVGDASSETRAARDQRQGDAERPVFEELRQRRSSSVREARVLHVVTSDSRPPGLLPLTRIKLCASLLVGGCEQFCRKEASRSSRETRARVFRCSPVARLGPITANRMVTCPPSIASKGTPPGQMSRAATLADHVLERAVRNGDPVANARRLKRFALAEHAVKVGCAGGRSPTPSKSRQRLARRRLWIARLSATRDPGLDQLNRISVRSWALASGWRPPSLLIFALAPTAAAAAN